MADRRMPWWLVALAAVGVLAAALVVSVNVPARGLAVRPGCSSSCPPENVIVKLYQPGHRGIWFDFIGQGSAADSPMIDSVRTLIADGFSMRVRGAVCGWKANPCVVIGSPGR